MITMFGRRWTIRNVSRAMVVVITLASCVLVVWLLNTPSDETTRSREQPEVVRTVERLDKDPGGQESAVAWKASPCAVNATVPKFYISTAVSGKLGNQMFQYAALLGIAYFNRMIPFYHPKTILRSSFQLTHLHFRSADGYHIVNEKDFSSYDPKFECLEQRNTLIMQYFQSWKYFDFMQETIRKEFTFQTPVRLAAENILNRLSAGMANRTRVGIHIRRGDMLMPIHIKKGYHVAPASYILKAMHYMRHKHRHVLFVVVSDDPIWCQSFLNTTDYVIASKASAEVHMAVLSLCDHVIMTVGTYGWWGGYLSGEVVYYWNPKHLLHSPPRPVEIQHPEDYFLPTWTP